MVHANELMVGDYLRVNRDGLCIPEGKIVRVTEVDSENYFLEKGLKGSARCEVVGDPWLSGGIWCDYLDPIPITGEILLKNGFNHDGMCSWELEDIHYDGYNRIRKYIKVTPPDPDNEWWSKEDSGFIVCTNWREINLGNFQDVSLHRLQHALRDCNVDKKIEL